MTKANASVEQKVQEYLATGAVLIAGGVLLLAASMQLSGTNVTLFLWGGVLFTLVGVMLTVASGRFQAPKSKAKKGNGKKR